MDQVLLWLIIGVHSLWTLAVVVGVLLGIVGWFRRHPRWQLAYLGLVSGTLFSWLVLDGDCLFTRWEETVRTRVAPASISEGGFLYHYVGGALERLGVSFGQDLFTFLLVGLLILGLIGQFVWLVLGWWRRRRLTVLLAVSSLLVVINIGGFMMIAAQELQTYLYPPLATEDILVRQGVVISATASELIIMNAQAEVVVVRLGGITQVRATDGTGVFTQIDWSALAPNQLVHATLDRNQPDAPARTIDVFVSDLSVYIES